MTNSTATTTNTTAAPSSDKCIKVSLGSEIRRLPFPIDDAADQFASLVRTITKCFNIARGSFSLQYTDNDGDVVTTCSTLELIGALDSQQMPLRLRVVMRDAVSINNTTATATATATGTATAVPTEAPAAPKSPSDIPRAHCGRRFFGRHAHHAWMHHGASDKYQEQLAELQSLGLNCGPWAARVLAKFDGNLEAAKEFILAKRSAFDELEQTYAVQLAALRDMGLLTTTADDAGAAATEGATPKSEFFRRHKQRKCLKLLERFDGDVQKVAEHVREHKAKCNRSPPHFEMLRVQYAGQLEQLKAQGFHCEGVCLRLLSKFDGDVDKVAQRLAKFRRFHHLGATAAVTDASDQLTPQSMPQCDKWAGKHGKWAAKHAKRCHKAQGQTSQYEPQVIELMSRGYARPACVRLLHKFSGDINAAESILSLRKQWFDKYGGDKKECHREFKQSVQRFSAELAQLKDMGFKNKWLLVPLLVQHNGDVAAVSLILSQ